MILVKCDRHGKATKIDNSDNYTYLVNKLHMITDELESEGIMLINKEITENLSLIYEFSSVENGWECDIVLAYGWAKYLRIKK